MGDLIKPGDRMLAVQSMGDLTHAERTVLSVIAWHDGEAGAWPSLERVAAIAVISRARASAIVGELERKGRLERRKDKGRISTSSNTGAILPSRNP